MIELDLYLVFPDKINFSCLYKILINNLDFVDFVLYCPFDYKNSFGYDLLTGNVFKISFQVLDYEDIKYISYVLHYSLVFSNICYFSL